MEILMIDYENPAPTYNKLRNEILEIGSVKSISSVDLVDDMIENKVNSFGVFIPAFLVDFTGALFEFLFQYAPKDLMIFTEGLGEIGSLKCLGKIVDLQNG